MKKGTIIGTIILGAIQLFIENIIGDAFHTSLCEMSKFGCFIGWVTYKSPLIIILIILLWNLYKEYSTSD